jgi:hypothetical protein
VDLEQKNFVWVQLMNRGLNDDPPVKSRLKVIDKPVFACDVKAVKGP